MVENRGRVHAPREYVFGPARARFQGLFPARDLGPGPFDMMDGWRVAFIPPRVSKISNIKYIFFSSMNARTPQMVKHVQQGARF